jgi:hypothetical protein
MGIQTDLGQNNGCSSLRDIAIRQMLRNGDWKRNQLYLPDHLIKIIKENPAYYERVENPMPLMIDRPRRVSVLQKMLKVYMAPTTLVVGKFFGLFPKRNDRNITLILIPLQCLTIS